MLAREWKATPMKYQGCDDGYSAAGGIPAMIDLFSSCESYERLKICIPERRSNFSYEPIQFGMTLFAGFLKGYDCLDDLDELQNDAAALQKLKEIPSSRTMGEFLRDFSDDQRAAFNGLLTDQSLEVREKLTKDLPLVIDLDSTSHVQRGKKIEGLAYNYKNEWCLDSLVAFDELGFCYGMELRAGSTFSSEGAPQMMNRIFSHPKLQQKKKKYFRADSAFCNEDVIRVCLNKKVTFTITAHGNMLWEEQVSRGEVKSWKAWEYTEEEKKAAEKSKVALPVIELGSYQYEPGWAPNIKFQVVVKRTWVEKPTPTAQQPGWKYYAVLTNWNLFYDVPQTVMAFHQKRGNAENFIREGKYGYDLKHFPCKKMNANHAYGLFALMVHNFIRTIAILDNPKNPHYSKKIRRKYIFIPSRVICSSRYWVVKIPHQSKKEVDRLTHAWAERFDSALKKAAELSKNSSISENLIHSC
jgi:hypothetical protein